MVSLDLIANKLRFSLTNETLIRTAKGIFPAALTAFLLCALVPTQTSAQPVPQQNSTAPAPASTAAPTGAPVVTYEDGKLSIVAENATLADIMAGLRKTMGTEVDLPAGSSSERIWAHLGPGSAHKVLSDLLANTDLNYIIQGSRTDAGAIQSVTLSVRIPDTGAGKGGPVEAAANRRGPRATPQPEPEPEPALAPQETAVTPATPPAPMGSQGTDSSAASSPAAATAAAASADGAAPAPADAPAPTAPVTASMSPTGTPNVYPETPQPSSGSFDAHPSPPVSMSTDQMVQQLSNMYQQRRQMQQSHAGSPN